MNYNSQYPDYFELQAIVERARAERSIALGNAVADLFKLVSSSLRRAAKGLRSADARESFSSAGVRASGGFEVAAHR